MWTALLCIGAITALAHGSIGTTFIAPLFRGCGREIHPLPVPRRAPPGLVCHLVNNPEAVAPDSDLAVLRPRDPDGSGATAEPATDLATSDGDTSQLIAAQVEIKVGSTVLLQPTSLGVRAGEMVAVIGPSGAGKSTLLKALAGVVRPSSGSVSLGGDDIALRLTETGYVPQFDTVHRQLTVTEALRFGAELRLPQSTERGARDHAVAEAIQAVGISHRADTRVGALSGGERKRVSVALEIVSQPRVLFLDEPTTGLDPGLELRMMELVRAQADSGRTVILVTHATQSLSLCHRLIVMSPGGRLVYNGPPGEAPEAFGVDSIEAIYTLFADPAVTLPETPAPSVTAAAPATTRENPEPAPALVPQVRTLVRRALLLMARDRRFVLIGTMQAVGLGVLTALLFKGNVFGYDDAAQCTQLVFLMVTITTWFGAIGAARQIVGERGVLRRELDTGLRVESYIAAKALVLGAMTLAQTLIFAILVFLFRPLHAGVDEFLLILTH